MRSHPTSPLRLDAGTDAEDAPSQRSSFAPEGSGA